MRTVTFMDSLTGVCPELQRAIKSNTVSSFKELTAMDENAFYNQDKVFNYAQARYLCTTCRRRAYW